MINVTRSDARQANPDLVELKRSKTKDWFGEALAKLAALEGAHGRPDSGSTRLLLVGGTSPLDFRLRVAQSHARHDLSPSHWSVVAFLVDNDSSALGVPLLQPAAPFAPLSNGVHKEDLDHYRNAVAYPNVALLSAPVALEKSIETLRKLASQRGELDALDLVVRWLAFGWGVGAAPNPLLEGAGIPAAAVVETVLAANDFDIAPGLPGRACCPEAIWQAAKWWRGYHDRRGAPGDSTASKTCRGLLGVYTHEHMLGSA